jgi:hypothetical protein
MIDTDRPDRSRELEAAAAAITPETLDDAKSAISFCLEEHLRWSGLFWKRLETIPDSDLHKFACALCLTMLGHLPTRPGTCPFCIQYGNDRSCRGCGYALTHGRCDSDDSAFSRFIESFQELGRAIYQDTSNPSLDPAQIRLILREVICASIGEARRMACELENASALDLMEQKSRYLKRMIGFLPLELFSPEVEESCQTVEGSLEDYW